MLLGTEIGAALTALEPFDVDIIGLNCATGPKEMNDAVRYLGSNSTKHDFRAAQCRPAAERGRPRGLQAHAGGTGGVSQAFHSGLRRAHCGRMLRHHAGAYEGRGRCCFRRRACEARCEADGGGLQRVHLGSARSRSQAADRGRGDEHHHAGGAFQEHGARQEVRRHSGAGEKAGERRLAHARPVLRHRGRGRKGLHHVRSWRRLPRACPRRFWWIPPKPTWSKKR